MKLEDLQKQKTDLENQMKKFEVMIYRSQGAITVIDEQIKELLKVKEDENKTEKTECQQDQKHKDN